MALEHGWAALHLEMPPRVPRTEYSAEMHWPLVSAATGIEVGPDTDGSVRSRAQAAFVKAWNYDLVWNTLIGAEQFGDFAVNMGHAEYMIAREDYDDAIRCAFSSPEEVLAFEPAVAFGERRHMDMVRAFEANYHAQQRHNPEAVGMTGVYVTCVSGLLMTFGWDLLLEAAGTDPAAFGRLTDRYCAWVKQYFEALADAEVPVVMVHDDMVWSSGPIFHPAWYREFVFPNLKNLIKPLRDAGKRILFTADGDYTMFVPDLVGCGIHGFVMEPMTDMALVAAEFGRTHVIVGNADTRVLLRNDPDVIRAEVARCMAIGKSCPGFFMAVGNHIPPNTPVEAALLYNETYERMARR